MALAQKNSVQYAVRTEKWRTRFFLATLAISECNAYLAYVHRSESQGEPDILSRVEWKLKLSNALINNAWAMARETRVRDESDL